MYLFLSDIAQHTSWLFCDCEYPHRVAADTWTVTLLMGRISKHRFYWNFTHSCCLNNAYLGLRIRKRYAI
jgi:hypothetical protein